MSSACLRIERHARLRSPLATAPRRRPARGARCRCAWLGDGVQLQPAALCLRKRSSSAARGASSGAARRSTTCLRSSVHERALIFEGRTRAGRNAGADVARCAEGVGTQRFLTFPDYGTSIGEEIAARRRASATTARTSCSLHHRQSLRAEARWTAGLKAVLPVSTGMASSIAAARPRTSTRMARRDAEIPSAPPPDRLARHRARDGRPEKSGRPRPLRTRPPTAPRACKLPPPGGGARLGPIDGERSIRCRRGHRYGRRVTTLGRQVPTSRAPASSTRARFQRRTGRADIIDQHHNASINGASQRRDDEGAAHVRVTPGGRRSVWLGVGRVRLRMSATGEPIEGRGPRLVEPARSFPPAMQRQRARRHPLSRGAAGPPAP